MQLVEEKMAKLDKICREANVMLVVARSYGLTGIVRVSVKVGLRNFDNNLGNRYFIHLYRTKLL